MYKPSRIGLLLVALVASFLCSCADKPNSLPVLKLAVNAGPEGAALKSLAQRYRLAKIEVVEPPYSQLREQLLSSLTDDQYDFDIVMIDDPWFPQLAPHLQTLENVPDKLLNDLLPNSADLGKYPYRIGSMRALPFVGNTQLLFVRSDLLDLFGSPGMPASWEDLVVLAESITKAEVSGDNGRIYGYTIRGRAGAPVVTDFLPIYWSLGGDLVDDIGNPTKAAVDTNIFEAALALYKRLEEASPPGAQNFDWTEMTAAFTSGQSVFQLNWPAAIPTIEEVIPSSSAGRRWDVAMPPKSSVHAGTSMIGNWLCGIPSDAKHPSEAEAFLVWAMAHQGEVAGVGNPPTRTSVFDSLSAIAGNEYFNDIRNAILMSTARARTEKWDQIEDEVSRAVSGYLAGKLTAREASLQLDNRLKSIL